MKRIWMMFLLANLLTFKAYAADNALLLSPGAVLFEDVQERCEQVGEITFGANARWSNCHVTRGRWVATIDLIDMYQAQYCLGAGEQSCEQRAWVLFANRAYTKEAKVQVVRMDTAKTIYEDPLVVIVGDERLMSMTSYTSEDNKSTNYYIWNTDHWLPIESQDWLKKLSAKLPQDTAIRQSVWPDLETMSADVNLFKSGDKDCCPTGGKANVELGFENKNFSVKKVHISAAAQ